MICSNCGAQHGCSCQSKVASDGTVVCTSCIQKYEMSKKAGHVIPTQVNPVQGTGKITPVITSVTFNNVNQ